MNARDICTMIGAFCMAFGETLKTLAPSATGYWIGLAMLSAGPILMGVRSISHGVKKTDTTRKRKP